MSNEHTSQISRNGSASQRKVRIKLGERDSYMSSISSALETPQKVMNGVKNLN